MVRGLQEMMGAHLRRGTPSSRGLNWLPPRRVMAVAALLAAISAGALLAAGVSLHVLLALSVLPLIMAVVWTSPRATIWSLGVWLVALGLVRRLTGSGSSTGLGDPLLLVGPAVLVLLVVVASGRGAFRSALPVG